MNEGGYMHGCDSDMKLWLGRTILLFCAGIDKSLRGVDFAMLIVP